MWLFGSAQEPGSFQRHADLDLAVEGDGLRVAAAARRLLERMGHATGERPAVLSATPCAISMPMSCSRSPWAYEL